MDQEEEGEEVRIVRQRAGPGANFLLYLFFSGYGGGSGGAGNHNGGGFGVKPPRDSEFSSTVNSSWRGVSTQFDVNFFDIVK